MHINDSTQEFPSPSVYADVTFLFAKTSPQELDATMRSLGAASKAAPYQAGWRFPAGSQQLLDFDLIEDVDGYAIDLIWKAWSWYIPLFDAVGVGPEDALILEVAVRNEPSAYKALHTFALRLLENHRGAVKDTNTNQGWTRDEIASHTIRGGQKFFGQ